MTRYIRVLLLASVTILSVSCIGITMMTIGTNLPAVKAGIEAQRAQAVADQVAAEAERAEAQAAIERAKAAQIEAEGQLAEAQAQAYVERELGRAAANAIERQGRLLTLSILSNGLRSFIFGMVAGSASTFGAIYILSHRKERQLCNARTADTT